MRILTHYALFVLPLALFTACGDPSTDGDDSTDTPADGDTDGDSDTDDGESDGLVADGPCDRKPVLAGCTAAFEVDFGSGSDFGTYTWNDRGLLAAREGLSRSDRFNYNDAGQVTEVRTTDGEGRTVRSVVYEYDAEGQLTELEQRDGEGQTDWTTTYTRDAQGRQTRSDQTFRDGSVATCTRSWDPPAPWTYVEDCGENRTRVELAATGTELRREQYSEFELGGLEDPYSWTEHTLDAERCFPTRSVTRFDSYSGQWEDMREYSYDAERRLLGEQFEGRTARFNEARTYNCPSDEAAEEG